VELTEERERHIRAKHSEVLEDRRLERTLARPSVVLRRGRTPAEVRLGRAFDFPQGRRHIVVVVVTDSTRATGEAARSWVVTGLG
jgi:hypothetical protein